VAPIASEEERISEAAEATARTASDEEASKCRHRSSMCLAGELSILLTLLLDGQAVGLDPVVLEDLDRAGHGADFVLALGAVDFHRGVAAGQLQHDRVEAVDRLRNVGGHEERDDEGDDGRNAAMAMNT